MQNESPTEFTERYKRENDRLKELESSHKVTGHATDTFVKKGRIYLVESQTLGIGITDIERRAGYILHGAIVSRPEVDTLVITYERSGDSICLVGPAEVLADLERQVEAGNS
jgi:hypothetical protein